MRRALAVAAFAALLPGTPSHAQPLYLTGEIGTAPALFLLEQDGEALTGWYFHFQTGKQVRLKGKRQAGGAFALDTFAADNSKTASFQGSIAGGRWRGSWRKAGGAEPLSVSLAENRDTLGALTADLRCTARKTDREFGYTFTSALRLAVRKGKVGSFALTSSARSRNDEQQCKVTGEDLTQVESDAGLLLEAQDGGPEATQKCAVRIVGAGGYFYVAVGDSSEPGNDCRGNGDTMFCSARGSWNSLIVDRRRGTCRQVE